MIIPIVFSLHPMVQEHSASLFIRAVCFSKGHGWPVFAQREILEIDTYPQHLKNWMDTGNAKDVTSNIAFERQFLKQCALEEFPQKIIDAYVSKLPSRTDAQLKSTAEPWPEMTAYLVRRVKEIEKERGEKIEAFMTQTASCFVQEAARELGVPVIDYELSSFRDPDYRTLARIDLKGSIGNGELRERYERFCAMDEQVPIFTKREILALTLKDEHLHRCVDPDIEPKYEAGITLGYSVPHIFTAYNQCSSIEMVKKARDVFGNDKICVRYHPGDPVHARIHGVKEEGGTLYDFIRKCRRIVCCTSNTSYEAMLYERPSYEMGWSQIADFANKSLDHLKDHIADDRFLSFVAFGYYVPVELLNHEGYLRWRISRPAEKEIYMYHLQYVLNCLGLEESVVEETPERMGKILCGRGYPNKLIEGMPKQPIWMKTDTVSQLMIQINRMEEEKRNTEKKVLYRADKFVRRAINKLRRMLKSR